MDKGIEILSVIEKNLKEIRQKELKIQNIENRIETRKQTRFSCLDDDLDKQHINELQNKIFQTHKYIFGLINAVEIINPDYCINFFYNQYNDLCIKYCL